MSVPFSPAPLRIDGACPPQPFSEQLPRVPEALQTYLQFVVWKLEHRNGNSKPAKIPYNPNTGGRASATEPATWGSLAQAEHAMTTGGYTGIGFVFTKDDPFVFLDFDDCRDDCGNWIDGASQWLLFSASAWEYSQSGAGLHVIVVVKDKTFLSGHVNKWLRPDGGMNECYGLGRFVAFGLSGWEGEPQPGDLLPLFVPLRTAQAVVPLEWNDAPAEGYGGPVDDADLIKRMLESRGGPGSVFGTSAPVQALWTAEGHVLGQHFPDRSGQGREFDHSSADMALMNALAWWTGCNPGRMWRLFQQSKLFRADKARTARRALIKAASEKAAKAQFLQTREHRLKVAADIGDGDKLNLFTPTMTLDQMLNDLVFVRDGNAVVARSRRKAQKMESARTDYAASKHEIETGKIDKETSQPVIKHASTFRMWQASEKLTVDQLTWQPGEAEFCKPLEEPGEAYNTYIPIRAIEPVANWHEWIVPFIRLVEFLVPVDGEKARFMQWLGHAMQQPQVLPHTSYLFFTPAHGTGRGTLAEILARVFEGRAAIGVSPEAVITDGFNGRLSKKVIATVDEIREGARSPHSKEAQKFKSRINEPNRHINPKFGVQSVEKNCLRWLFFSQYEDALPFDNKDRRVIVIANPTSPKPAEWYIWLRQFIDNPVFTSSVTHYLATLDISSFNPGAHAPMNEAKARALKSMEGPALKAVRQFAAAWPEGLSTNADLRDYVGDDDWPTHSSHVASLIRSSGMESSKKVKVGRKTETVLIVKPNSFPPDVVGLWPPQQIAQIIERGREKFAGSAAVES